ncbi:MAG: hypothetical protein JXQ74_00585 [Alphaproteobacteria bacterium]|nr:hypothetical protein [Alphaproteobacteria bacterium]
MRNLFLTFGFLLISISGFAQYNDQADFYQEETTMNREESFYSEGGYTPTSVQNYNPADVTVANGTVIYPEKSYFVPYHVRRDKNAIPQVTPPPVLYGEDLYYPYQLSKHTRFENEQDINRFVSACRPGTGCAVRPAVICRRAGCTRLNDRITKQFLFNSLIQIFLNNKMTKVDLCEADPHSRACLANSIRFGGNIGSTPALVQIPSFTLVEMQPLSNLNRLNLFIRYDVFANGLQTRCSGAMSTIEAISSQQLIMRDNNFQCDFTFGMPTSAFAMYNIDYIDLDYGIIGAFYSIGLSGDSAAGGTGYVLMKFRQPGQVSTRMGVGSIIPEGNFTTSPYSEDSVEEDCDSDDDECGADVDDGTEEAANEEEAYKPVTITPIQKEDKEPVVADEVEEETPAVEESAEEPEEEEELPPK